MMEFLERIESALLSEDPFVQHYAVTILENSYLATEDTLFTALKAYDRGKTDMFPASILPHIAFMPISEKGMQEIISRIEKKDEHLIWFIKLAASATTDLLLKYKDRMLPYANRGFFQTLEEIKQSETSELHHQLKSVIHQLDSDFFNSSLFDLGKRIIRELMLRNEIEEEEIVSSLCSYIKNNDFIPYDGIYKIFLAGELRIKSLVPDFINILKVEEDLALEEVTKALIKMGTDTVVKEVEKIALHKNAYFYTINALAKIKSPEAEAALLRIFEKTDLLSVKTLIADALCQHLSVEGIPHIEGLLQTGYDSSILDLKEAFYANLKINGIDHPNLEDIKRSLEEEVQQQREIQERLESGSLPIERAEHSNKSQKIGRNELCLCGSGKKYKKCCMN